MEKKSTIYVAGHRGLVGSAIYNCLKKKGYENIVVRTHKELDLTNQKDVHDFFEKEKPEYVILAAAKVGGILANNQYRGAFIYDNLMIQNNVIHQSYLHKVKKLLFLGSTCIYPKNSPQPMKEEYLLTDTLEYTNEPYAIAKIAGIKMCESYNLQYGTNFLAVMPTNLYGPNDNFDLEKSHVLPALIRKIHLAKLLEQNKIEDIIQDTGKIDFDRTFKYLEKNGITKLGVEIWGSGEPKREFLWSEDMAEACVHLMQHLNFTDLVMDQPQVRNTHINIGTGVDISIRDLAALVKEIIGYKGNLHYNTSKPDGTYRKLTDVTKINGLGWKHTIELKEGITKLYHWYCHNTLKC
jgi:GDP-L-fucose synthase